MKRYLVVFECPCMGLSEELVSFDTDKQVSDWAWERSEQSDFYVMGSYDIYRLTYDNHLELKMVKVDELALWAGEVVEV